MLKQFFYRLVQFFQSFKKYFIAFGCVILLLSSIKILSSLYSTNYSDSDYEDYFNEDHKVFSIRIPKKLNLAGEKVPIANFKVREAIEHELIKNTFWQSHSLLLHQRANRWFPLIERILKKNNVPEDFKYLALIESQLSNVVSPQGATGFWQLVAPTAKNYGLEITDEVDERYDAALSTQAACRYFNEAYKLFNNWTLVAASYNLGMTGIQSQLAKQKVDNYYELALTEETAQFVYRILAMKEIISRPKVYGFILRKKDMFPVIPSKKIVVDSTIHNITDFAIAQGSNYKIVQFFNPWLRANTLTNTAKKKYIIEIPKQGVKIYGLDEDFKLNDTIGKKDSLNQIISNTIAKDTLK
ncbi:MAG: lytic transglycosylase domain-containing protein [Bacteroidetes bacterium]|nr:lytic transglycosylase domain-containing protein [Bacteroidota bacterium]